MMYPEDTICGVDNLDTPRIIARMTDWVDRAKARMTFLRMNQEDLRDAFGVKTRGAVGHYLTRRRSPTPDQIIALADKLRMTVGELLAGERVEESHDSVRSQSVGFDGRMISETAKALRIVFARRGITFDIEKDSNVFAVAYSIRAQMTDEVSQEELLEFGMALADMADVGSERYGRDDGDEAGGVDRGAPRRKVR
jgi:transcriptional regulator with XRE-family HTH domain